ncbi:MAG TPA: HepT-like ribonuclease domain-containing protein [Gemmatirosa sp.]
MSAGDDPGPAPLSPTLRAVERLEHMRTAVDTIAGYVARGRAAFDADPAIADAVLYQLVVLGEAAKAALQADPSLATRFPAVPWSSMARVRDRAAHHYYTLDRDVVWETSRTAVPIAAVAVEAALQALARPDH